MSQRSSAGRPASRHPSISPTASLHTPPSNSHQTGMRSGGDMPIGHGPQQSSGISRNNGERPLPYPPRGLGVHNMLNPSDAQATTRTGIVTGPNSTETPNANPNQPTGPFVSCPSTPRPLLFSAPAMGDSRGDLASSHRHPSSVVPTLDRGMERRHSSAVHSLPGTMGAPRRYLTPRSPRSGSLGQSSNFRPLNPPTGQYFPANGPGPVRPFPGEGGQEPPSRQGAGQQQQPHFSGMPSNGPNHPPGPPPPPGTLPGSRASPRSLTQLNTGPFPSMTQPPQGPLQGPPADPNRPLDYQHPPAFMSGTPTGRGFPASTGMTTPGDSQYSGSMSCGGGGGQTPATAVKSGSGSEGQYAVKITPSHGEEIFVPVDVHQASRQADEKRLRNAGASARFRARKKERERNQSVSIQKLETQNRDLEKKVEDLETERNHLRSDRDRLRDLVYRTPGISELAYQGPISPSTPRAVGPPPPGGRGASFSDRSVLNNSTIPPPPPLPAAAYGAADPMTGERASRRRRTDPHVEFGGPAYLPTAGSLHHPQHSSHNISQSQPGTPNTGDRTSRLPPLRLDHPPSEPNSAVTPSQNLPPFKREPYESGWASKPNGPPPGPNPPR